MARVLAGFVAIVVGLAATLFGLWRLFGGAEAGEASLGWAAGMSMLFAPIFAMAMVLGILFLEGVARWTKRPRALVLIFGSLLIPIGLGLVMGLPNLLFAPFYENARNMLPGVLVIAGGAAVPCFITCTVYALLSAGTRDA